MGWWKIKNVKTGQVDKNHKCPTNEKFTNAVPGYEMEDVLYNGDYPADMMGDTLRNINKEYKVAWGRDAKKKELKACFNFCLNGMMRMRANGKSKRDING